MFKCILISLCILPFLSEGHQVTESIQECGYDIVAFPGHITSPGYPQGYPGHTSCRWFIRYPQGYDLTLRLTDMDVEEDPVCLQPPCCTHNWLSIASSIMCGRNTTIVHLNSTKRFAMVKFHSSKVVSGGRGFRLEFFTCRKDQFRCADNESCINSELKCDGVEHCRDSSDELQCNNVNTHLTPDGCNGEHMVACGGSDYGCYNNVTERCNGIANCPVTGSDEKDCGVCGPNMLYCKSGGCYPPEGSCDNVPHCAGGWDEGERGQCAFCAPAAIPCGLPDSCGCFEPRQRCDGQMDCPHGQDELSCVPGCEDKISCASVAGCYSPEERCDGHSQCSDNSDEVECISFLSDNNEDAGVRPLFKCKSSPRCVDHLYVCDDKDDCEDGSDEENCISNSTVTMIVVGSLSCGMLAILLSVCVARYYAVRRALVARHQRRLSPADEGPPYRLYREPPPSYREAVLQGACPAPSEARNLRSCARARPPRPGKPAPLAPVLAPAAAPGASRALLEPEVPDDAVYESPS